MNCFIYLHKILYIIISVILHKRKKNYMSKLLQMLYKNELNYTQKNQFPSIILPTLAPSSLPASPQISKTDTIGLW